MSELIPWRAQPGPQLDAIRKHHIPELFFGGAVGGGKSDYLLGDYGQDVATYGAAWKGIMFRRSYPQLEELVARSKQIYPQWFGLSVEDCWRVGDHTWTFPNGATLKFRHADDDDAFYNYQGQAYTWIAFDEMPQWPSAVFYMNMKSRLRSGGVSIPNQRIRGTGNPGGIGHEWIKSYFKIDGYPLGGVILPEDDDGGQRMFVRSKVTDNKILLQNDPKYIKRLSSLGSETLVKMYLDGDWNVISGAYYPEFSAARHLLRPFAIPKHWTRFRAMDWGSSAPFSVGWYAVADGSPVAAYDGPALPRGALVKYREWYGAKKDKSVWVGLKMSTEDVAKGIKEREEKKETFDMSVIDPSAFKEDGGPSHAERFGRKKIFWQRGDNQRVSGWQQVRDRLIGVGEQAMIYFFTTCEHTIRTMPMMQHDKKKVEDMDTQGEDHACDETRYACMSRPWVRPDSPAPHVEPQYQTLQYGGMVMGQGMSFNQIVQKRTRTRKMRERGF